MPVIIESYETVRKVEDRDDFRERHNGNKAGWRKRSEEAHVAEVLRYATFTEGARLSAFVGTQASLGLRV